jgi:crotonobetainyl-CoA:carnitine CoA-transferase CaiB-like acyl-CoA transferase
MAPLLQGIRVLDFGRYIAGPYCAAMLAEYGADVIRIEKRDGSEDRFTAPLAEGAGSLFLQMNRNKRSMTLDPASPGGREVVARMVKGADVVIANLPAATLKSMGLDYETLKSYRPDIIFVTNTAYGPVGPMSKNVGFDTIGQAMSGTMYMTGDPGRPTRAAANWVDFGTALHCAFGTMAALMQRSQTGQGQMVTGALLATAIAVNNGTLIEQHVAQVNRVPTGNRGQTSAPVDVFEVTDGFILLAVTGNPLYRRWAKLMAADTATALPDDPDWLNDPRFATDESRGIHRDILSDRMGRWCRQRDTQTVVDTLGEAMIPAAPVLSPQQALDHPQVQAMGLMQPMDYPGLARPAPVADVPVWLSETQRVPRQRAPTIGEHTDQVLGELGYNAETIAGLRAQKVI